MRTFGNGSGNAAKHHRRQLAQHRKRMTAGMQANKLIENFAARLVAAKRVNGQRRVELLRLFVERIVFRAAAFSGAPARPSCRRINLTW